MFITILRFDLLTYVNVSQEVFTNKFNKFVEDLWRTEDKLNFRHYS